MKSRLNKTKLFCRRGDLLVQHVDAIVCPANSQNQMRGGIALRMCERGGDGIETEAMSHAPVPIGSAVLTHAGSLPAKFVIHTPTMIRPVEPATREAVSQATYAALLLADDKRFKTIAFPSMGTGVGGMGYMEAALAMLDAIHIFLHEYKTTSIRQIRIIPYSIESSQVFKGALQEYLTRDEERE